MRRFIVFALSFLAAIVLTDESSAHNAVKRQATSGRGSRQLFSRYRSRQFPQPEEEEEYEGGLPSTDYVDERRTPRFRNRQQSSLDEDDPYVYIREEALPPSTTTTTTVAPPTPPPSSINTRRSFPRFASRPKLFSPSQTPEPQQPIAESSIPAPSPTSQQLSPYEGGNKRIYSRPRGSFRAAQSDANDYYQEEEDSPPVTQYQPYSPPSRQTPAPRRPPPPSFRARPSRQEDRDSSNQAPSVPPIRTSSSTTAPPARRQQGRRGRPRARARARTTTTTTTTTTTEEPDYYYYDDDESDYPLPPTTTTTTTTRAPKKPAGRRFGNQRGSRRGGGSSSPRPVIKFDPESQFLPPPEDAPEPLIETQTRKYTTSSTTTTTTTPRPPSRKLKPRTDGRMIDYLADPNYPRELTGVDLTNYPFYITVPENINFECDGRHDGYYASVPLFCQVFHYCFAGARYDFLCPNYTLYDQLTFTCRFVNNVNCANSEQYYNRNDMLYVETTTLSSKEQSPREGKKKKKKSKEEKKEEEEEEEEEDED